MPIRVCSKCKKISHLQGSVRSTMCLSCAQTGGSKGANGIYYRSDGYRELLVDGKRVLEHRHLMELHLGRKLSRREIVHHKNHNRLDNNIENLEVLTQSEHRHIHAELDRRLTDSGLECFRCKQVQPLTAFHKRNNRPLGVQGTCRSCRKEMTNATI